MLLIIMLLVIFFLSPILIGGVVITAVVPIIIRYIIPLILAFYWFGLISTHVGSTIKKNPKWFLCYLSEIIIAVYEIVGIIRLNADKLSIEEIIILLAFFLFWFMSPVQIIIDFPTTSWLDNAESESDVERFYRTEKEDFSLLVSREIVFGILAFIFIFIR